MAFQASDLLAYEYFLSNRKIYESGVGTLTFEEMRKSLQALDRAAHGDEDWGVHDLESLQEYCDDWNFKPRHEAND